MKFEVPQFIDVEDKIVGPFTFRQFAYLVGGAGLCYIALKIIPGIFCILAIIPIAGISIALAFIKVNNKPLLNVVESAFNYTLRKKLYLWKKEEKLKTEKKEDTEVKTQTYLPRISESKLHDISWGLDVLNKDGSQQD